MEPTGKRTELSFTPAQVLVLGFASLILVGAILLWLPISQAPGQSISFVDALFTATSAVCVTGLVVVDTATHFSLFGQIVVITLIQCGGLGIMTLSALMFLLMGRRISLQERLMMQEALGSFSIAGVVRLTKNIILTTFAIEGVGALLLTLRFMVDHPFVEALYWGIFHSVSAFNNAGFDLTSASLRVFQTDPFIIMVISLLIIMGGIGFFVMEDVWRKRHWERFSLQSRIVLRMTGWLLAIGTVLFLLLEWSNPQTLGGLGWVDKVFNAFFASVTPRTAGFESVPSGSLTEASLLLTMILMFIGASPGGTGGGIKTTTFSLIGLTVRGAARGSGEITVMGRRMPKDLLDKAVAVAAIAMSLILGVTGLMLVTERQALADPTSGVRFVSVLFEVVSAFGTVGLTAGLTPKLTILGRLLITMTMFVGRVGPLTLAVALAQRKMARTSVHYPEERVMIG